MKSAYIPAIDGLRALAVIAVMIFHLQGSFLPGGFTGVDIFFVISGYVVARSLAAREPGNFSSYIVAFYRRRILRIFPALITCLVLTSCIVIFFIPQAWLSQSISNTALAAFFGVSNIALAMNTDTYFSPSVEFNPFVHTWSLGVEEQFYILFPVLFYFWLQGKFRPAVVTVGLISLAISAWHSGSNTNLAYYLLTSRFWELAAGAMLYQYHHGKDMAGSRGKANAFAVSGLILIAAGLMFADKASFPLPWGLLPVLGTVALIHGIMVSGEAAIIKPFSLRTMTYIGKLSYSLYLWHWPVYTFFRWSTGLQTAYEMASAVAITIVLGVLSYHFIERGIPKLPFIRNLSPKGTVGWGSGAITLTFVCTFLGFTGQKFLNFSNTNDRYVWYPYYSHQAEVEQGDALKGRTLYVIGDSHAGAYSTMLRMLADETGIKTKIYSSGGCGVSNLREPVLVAENACQEKLAGCVSVIQRFGDEYDVDCGAVTSFSWVELDTGDCEIYCIHQQMP
ncbi:acyltransferase family protein [Alteromonas confluentis]|uniref:Acyltransferase n=1 Tax=Alteromonas confluentis TaxID=1656094 RepID=A0A1E7ZFZ7_9ALTE|nr:acyltransferase [Alteromonas confluentis]OFC72443.1 hypothetical protein BFC18_02440 [Alteromonas confluentis]